MERFKKKTVLLLVSFSWLTTLANEPKSEMSYSDFNGIYEGVVQSRKSRGAYGLGGNKSLVRLHVFVYNYPNPKYRDMYNRETRKIVKPKTVMGLLEVYDNKRGKGTPARSYFTARGYLSSTELNIDYIEKYAAEQNGQIKLNSGKISKFTIPQHSAGEFEMKVGYSYQGKYRKVRSYQRVPNLFYPYFESLLKASDRRGNGRVSLGSSGYGNQGSIYTENPSVNETLLKAVFSYRNSTEFSYENPAISWIEDMEYQLKNALKNQSNGAHQHLKYLPNANKLAVHINTSRYSSSKQVHFFDVIIKKNSDRLDFEVVRTSVAKACVSKAKVADNNRRIAAQKKRIEQERIRKIKEQKEQIAAQKERERIANMLQETTPTGEPTEAQMKFAIEYQYKVKKGSLDRMANLDISESQNPVAAMSKLIGMSSQTVDYTIKSFKKYGCVSAESVGKPGFNCDYSIEINIGGSLGSYYGSLLNNTGTANINSSRFLKVNGIWMLVD
nr:hypothetical protein [Allomuricauda sp.]